MVLASVSVKASELRLRDQSHPGEFLLQVGHTSEFDQPVLTRARELLDLVFDGEMTDDDWEHALGGVHAIVRRGTSVVGHASLIQRRLVHGGHALRTGYVEGVGVHPNWQRHGLGGQMMEALERIVETAYDVGALGASDDAVTFYEHRGWLKWLGPTSALTPAGIVHTPDEDGYIYVLPTRLTFDIAGELTCDWREGDVW